jgi:hypothetical protein
LRFRIKSDRSQRLMRCFCDLLESDCMMKVAQEAGSILIRYPDLFQIFLRFMPQGRLHTMHVHSPGSARIREALSLRLGYQLKCLLLKWGKDCIPYLSCLYAPLFSAAQSACYSSSLFALYEPLMNFLVSRRLAVSEERSPSSHCERRKIHLL